MFEGWTWTWTTEQRLIAEHVISTLEIELGLGLVRLVGWSTMSDPLLSYFVGTDEFAMFVVFLWLLRNLGITLWNNRERIQSRHGFVLS